MQAFCALDYYMQWCATSHTTTCGGQDSYLSERNPAW